MTATGYTGGDPSKLDIDGYVKGDVIAANTSGILTAIPVGTDTEVLTADSSDAEGVDWAPGSGGGGTPSNTVVTETTFGQASTAGAATAYSRGDHTHGTPAAPAVPAPATTVVSETAFGQSPAVGTDAIYARQDHTHGTPASPAVPVAGNTVVAATTFGLSPTAGVDSDFSREDHSHGTPATPATTQLDPKGAIYGLDLAVLGPYELNAAAITVSAGTLILNRVWVPSALALTHLGTWMRVAGITANGLNGMAVYNSSGTLLEQTVSMDTQFASADQYVEAALGSTVNLTANTAIYIAILTHFGGGNPSVSGKIVGVNMIAINGSRPSVFLTAQATFPASITLGSANVNDAAYCLYAR